MHAAALKDAKPVQFKDNIALVLKYFDKLPTFTTLNKKSWCALHAPHGGFASDKIVAEMELRAAALEIDLMTLLSPKPRIGRVQLRVRRAFLASPNRELTTRELMEWTHSRRLYQGHDSHRERHNYCRAIRRAAERYAVRVGRVRPGGVVWRLAD